MTEAILQKIDKERVFGHSFILDDAFALLKGGAKSFLECFSSFYKSCEREFCQIVIFGSNINESGEQVDDIECLELMKRVKTILNSIQNTCSNCLEVVGNRQITFGDMLIYRTISRFGTIGTVLLVTDDKNMPRDCHLRNGLKSQEMDRWLMR